MEITAVIDELGGTRKVAHWLGIGSSAVRAWAWNGRIPPKHHTTLIDLAKRLKKSGKISRRVLEQAGA